MAVLRSLWSLSHPDCPPPCLLSPVPFCLHAFWPMSCHFHGASFGVTCHGCPVFMGSCLSPLCFFPVWGCAAKRIPLLWGHCSGACLQWPSKEMGDCSGGFVCHKNYRDVVYRSCSKMNCFFGLFLLKMSVNIESECFSNFIMQSDE